MTNNLETKPTILVVEDNEINRNMLLEFLLPQYNVITAANGLEAIDVIEARKNDISLILLDIVLPTLNGFEVLEEMNESGWIETIPVIIVSSEGTDEFKERAYLSNVCGFITKPFTYNEVMSCVKMALP